MYFFVFMVSVLSCTEHVQRNFSYKLLKLSKSIIDSLVRILFNKISRRKQVELLFLKEGINSMFYHTCLLPYNCCCGGRLIISKLFVVCSLYSYTGAPLVETPFLGTHYIVSCDAEVCGAERKSSRMIQGRIH